MSEPSERNEEEQGFDAMLGSALSNGYDNSGNTTDKDASSEFLAQIREEDAAQKAEDKVKSKKRLKIFWIVFASVVVVITIVVTSAVLAVQHEHATDGKITVNYSSSDLVGQNYEVVVEKLENSGFTNIDTKADPDLITGWIHHDGEVEEVDINGDTTFDSWSRYLPDCLVIVTYHTF